MRWLAYVALAAGMILFGSATPLARLVTEDLPPLVASALRVLLAGLVLFPIAYGLGFRWSRLDRGDWQRAGVLAAVGMFGFTIFLAYGMSRVSGVTGSIIMGTTPAVTAAAAVLFLGERSTWRRWLAVGLAVAGVVLMRFTGGAAEWDLIGAGLVFGAVLAEATYTLVGKRLMMRHDAVVASMLATVLSLPLFLVVATVPLLGVDWSAVGTTTWLGLAAWGLGTLALGSVVWYWGVKRVEGHQAAPFMGLMPVSALVLSYWLLGEDPQWWHAAGLALVLGGIGLVVWDQIRSDQEAGHESAETESGRGP